jgi:hypothetical protein
MPVSEANSPKLGELRRTDIPLVWSNGYRDRIWETCRNRRTAHGARKGDHWPLRRYYDARQHPSMLRQRIEQTAVLIFCN